MEESGFRIAGAGLVALDVVICEDRSPPALTFAGGTCGNVLAILSYLKWHSSAVGVVGDDEAGSRVLADLISVGVDAQHLRRDASGHTPVFVQTLRTDPTGHPRHTFSNVCPSCGQEVAHARASTKQASIALRDFTEQDAPDVFFMDRLSTEILRLAKSAKENGSMIVYEPSAKTDSTHWQAVFPLLDVIKYSADRFNESEFAGVMSLKLTDSLWEIQTLGARGLKFRKHEGHKTRGWTLSPAIAAPRVVDTCGAGDWCSAGLLQGLINSKFVTSDAQFAESIRLGQAFAAWACAFVGARGAMYCHDADSSWRSVKDLLEGKSVDVANMAPEAPPADGQVIGRASPSFASLCSGRDDSKDA